MMLGPDNASSGSAFSWMRRHPQAGLLAAFLILYAPFLVNHGYRYLRSPSLDLPSFHAAAKVTFALRGSPYNRQVLKTQYHGRGVFPYLYPPPSLLLFAPMSLMSYEHTHFAHLALNHLLVLLLLWLLVFRVHHRAGGPSAIARAVVLVYFFQFYPIAYVLSTGQVNLVVVCSLCLSWVCLRRDKSMHASVFLSLAILAKTYPAVPAVFLLLCRRFKTAWLTALWLCAFSLVALVAVPWEAWSEWFREVLPRGGYGETPQALFHPAVTGNQSLNGLFSRLFTRTEWSYPIVVNPALGKLLTYAAALAVLAASAWAVHRAWRRDAASALDHAMCVALPAMVLVAPFSWEHHLVFVLPVATLLLGRLADEGQGLPWPPAALTLVGAILMAPEYMWRFNLPGVLCIWGAALYLALADKAPAAEPQPVHGDASPGQPPKGAIHSPRETPPSGAWGHGGA